MFNLSDKTKNMKVELSFEDLLQLLHEAFRLFNKQAPPKAKVSEILNVAEAAEFLRLEVSTIYQMTSKRTINFYKKNKRIYFKRTELEAYLEEGKKNARPQKQVSDSRVDAYIRNNKKDEA